MMTDAEKIEVYDWLDRNLWAPVDADTVIHDGFPEALVRLKVLDFRQEKTLGEHVQPYLDAEQKEREMWFEDYSDHYTDAVA